MASSTIISFFLFIFFFGSVNSFFTPAASSWGRLQSTSLAVSPQDDGNAKNVMLRREMMQKSLTFGALLNASPAYARSAKSRTTGYDVQHTEAEWAQMLSPQQSFILRQGGTESPYSSILEGEDRAGLFVCAGCGTPLFNSKEKFHSGTGWPSYAAPTMSKSSPDVSNVEMEDVSTFQYQLAGAEVRCRTCGGHLGDVFADGFLFPGTPAFATGKRYCIDGGALIFVPNNQSADGELEFVRGDLPPAKSARPVFQG
mmetsp:Transcript_18582/g.28687  ORF Transcript_18582/g.28687 Transcript_18582/m.28687 type:complete len:256 (+) Transcript_18582:47-814(+)